MVATTIQIGKKTRERLAQLKSTPRETYDELLNNLMELIPEGDDEGKYTPGFRAGLLRARLDSIHGRVSGMKDVKKRLGIR